MRLFGAELSRTDLAARAASLAQVGGIEPFRYAEGRAEGVRAYRIDTGVLNVECVADRGLDLARAAYRGTPFVWRTAVDMAAPAFYEPEGDAWLRTFFGGWLTTCGLANFGPAGRDAYGAFGLHGRANVTPATEVRATTRWEGDRCLFELSGTLRESVALGPVLTLYRTLRMELGEAYVAIEDRVVNEGRATSPHMLLYHCNAGWPLLDAGARVHTSRSGLRARDAAAAAGLDAWDRGAEPVDAFPEQVFVHTAAPCADGRARALIANDALGFGFVAAFDPAALPALVSWRKLEAGDDVMAVEPANTPTIEGREAAGRDGTLPMLEPGEERRYALELRVVEGDELRATAATIAAATAAAGG